MAGSTPNEVSSSAATRGIRISAAYVKRIRYLDRQAAKSQGPRRATRRRSSSFSFAALAREEGLEAQLRRAIAEVGLSHARDVLAEVERRFASSA